MSNVVITGKRGGGTKLINKRGKRGKYELCAINDHRTLFLLVPELAFI